MTMKKHEWTPAPSVAGVVITWMTLVLLLAFQPLKNASAGGHWTAMEASYPNQASASPDADSGLSLVPIPKGEDIGVLP